MKTDKIEYLNAKHHTQENIIGGAGTYAALGARLAAGIENAHLVSWIVDVGADFPPSFQRLIDTWGTNCIFRIDLNRLTTTAWNGYGEDENRAFKYLTPKIRLWVTDLSDEQVLARSFHMVCSPARCITLVQGILNRRQELLGVKGTNSETFPFEDGKLAPVFVWEPVPDLCTPDELTRLREAAGYVNVVSPNAEEFASFFEGISGCESRESQVHWLLRGGRSAYGQDQENVLKAALVIREGAHGCTTYTARSLEGLHLRAHHQSKARVVDPTGGGNTFLGALAIGLTGVATPGQGVLKDLDVPMDQRELLLALIHSTVAAGYAIEQTGMPAVSETDGDSWNGEKYSERFLEYLKREQTHLVSQFSQRSVRT